MEITIKYFKVDHVPLEENLTSKDDFKILEVKVALNNGQIRLCPLIRGVEIEQWAIKLLIWRCCKGHQQGQGSN